MREARMTIPSSVALSISVPLAADAALVDPDSD
jgi:hypothetical protein